MELSLTAALLSACLLYLLYLVLNFPNRGLGVKPRPDLRGPHGWPLIGNMITIVVRGPRQLEWGLNMIREYGPGVTQTVPGIRMIDISKVRRAASLQARRMTDQSSAGVCSPNGSSTCRKVRRRDSLSRHLR